MKRLAWLGAGILSASACLYWLPDGSYGRDLFPWFAGIGFLTLTLTAAVSRRLRAGSAGTVQNWSARARRRHGVASTLDIARVASSLSVRCEAKVMRPTMRDLTWVQRARVPTTELGVPLCRIGAMRVWTSLRNVITIFGGPGTGKSGWLGGRIIDAPGAVISTSTRLDLYNITAELRRSGDRPVYVFNPGGLGGLPSTVTFDPLHGCEDPLTAVNRATDLIPDTGGDEGGRWDAKARRNLAVLLHAAAVAGHTCAKVAEWISDINRAELEILAALRRSPEPAFLSAAKSLIGLNDRTQSSILEAIAPAFAWLIDPDAVTAASDANHLDVETLLREQGTVYLLGREEGHTAPLLAALTGHIARTARKLAAEQPGGRLDPHLTLALDEAARIAPIPADDWTGDMGGSGVQLILAFQSRADMIERWGKTGAARILNNSGAILVFGGTNDGDDLEAWSTRAGHRDEPTELPGRGKNPSKTSVRRVPVLSPAQIANLPAQRVLVICRGMPPAIGRVTMAWKRRDVRRANRLTKIAPPEPVSAPAPAARKQLADEVDLDRARENSIA